jgi:hypothetical protein
MATSTLLEERKNSKRKFIGDQNSGKDDNGLTIFEKMKTARPGQPLSLWTCTSKIFGGCQETKEVNTALDEKKIPYYSDVETCNLHCGLPKDLINEIGMEFSSGKSASSLRQTTSLLKDLEKGREEKNEQRLLELTNNYLEVRKLYYGGKIDFQEFLLMEGKSFESMKEMFKYGQGKDFFNLVLKKVLTSSNNIQTFDLLHFLNLVEQLPQSFLSRGVDWSSLIKIMIDSSNEQMRRDRVNSLALLLGYIVNVISPFIIDEFFRKYPDYLGVLTNVLDNFLKKYYSSNWYMLETLNPPELSIPLFSPTFLRYYLEHSKFEDPVSIGSFLYFKNNQILGDMLLQPTSEKTSEVLENIERYKENQIILDSLFPVENYQEDEGDEQE